MDLSPLGDCAIVVSFGDDVDEATLARVSAMTEALENKPILGVSEVVPAFASVTAFYDPRLIEYEVLAMELRARADKAERGFAGPKRRVREIPVCYGGEFGPDLEEVAQRANMKSGAVIALHAGGDYRVHAIGFAPGFAYLGGLAEKIHTPRRPTPRTGVPAGTVGIGGAQTGVYPLATPGGWNLIGRTPLRLFDPARDEPAWLRAGDCVVFRAITREEFVAWK